MIQQNIRTHPIIFVLILSIIGSTGCQPSSTREASNSKPNVIFIMVDDLGYGDLGSYGQQKIPTPQLDQMARDGKRFTRCYAGAPVCAPSRSVLMTGRHTGHTTIRGNFSAIEVPELPLPRRIPLQESDTTLAEIFKMAGYITGMTGKWGLGEATTSGEPNAQGFDHWLGYNNQRRAHDHYPDYIWDNRDTLFLEGNFNDQEETHTHNLFTQFALDFLEQHRDTSFFLYVPYCLPHAAFQATDPFIKKFSDKPWTDQEKKYAAMVSMVDDGVGQILNKLQELNLDSSTLVFFCSDNGAADRYDGTFNSSGELKGRKRDMYEGGIRTPMMVRMPGKVPAGKTSDYIWYFTDVLPSMASIIGQSAPGKIDGEDVSEVFFGEVPADTTRFLYWEFHERGFDQAAIQGKWKGIRHGLDSALELYNLDNDPGEEKNISTEYPELTNRLTQYLDTSRTKTPYWPVE